MKQSDRKHDPAAVFVARHCKTAWNIEGRIQGSIDLPLCDAGLKQAAAIAPTLVRHRFDRIISSPYRRAMQTAAVYAAHLQIATQAHDGLKELNHGDWEGVQIEKLLQDQGSGYQQWIQDALCISIPGGEEIAAAQQRISEAIRDIAAQYPGQRVLVVTHKHIRAVLSCRLRSLSLSSFGRVIDERVEPVAISTRQLHQLSTIDECARHAQRAGAPRPD